MYSKIFKEAKNKYKVRLSYPYFRFLKFKGVFTENITPEEILIVDNLLKQKVYYPNIILAKKWWVDGIREKETIIMFKRGMLLSIGAKPKLKIKLKSKTQNPIRLVKAILGYGLLYKLWKEKGCLSGYKITPQVKFNIFDETEPEIKFEIEKIEETKKIIKNKINVKGEFEKSMEVNL